MDYNKNDYYRKYDFYFAVLGCACLLTFLAIVFLNPKGNNTNATTEQVTDKKTVKEDLDDLSKRLEIIREKLQKQEAMEKEVK